VAALGFATLVANVLYFVYEYAVLCLQMCYTLFTNVLYFVYEYAEYNSTIGVNLGIIGANHVTNIATLKPLPKLKKIQQGIFIKYAKLRMGGAVIFSRRGSETVFTRLEKVTLSTYTDTRPNLDNAVSEIREYYLVYFKNDELVGVQSDVASVRC
jgi:hypothetical protein